METIILVIQIVISVALIGSILLQSSSAGLGGAFGGSDSVDAGLHTRRGPEKIIFFSTIVLGILFVVISLIAFLVL